ncbi:hypothetical protein IV203_033663 [Nitzschia inconspicua]|uniref:Uncharacterized protein n=1 Tax=Nitzschia inconspicua TaxID=303405 RepID=A0A9K3M380_9STRA|nr:hypothetical protein IV203_033663 [Nitzschia inconspicua]
MAPRTAVSRKRDRRTMMRQAELRKQRQQQQQQQQDQHLSAVGEGTENDNYTELIYANDDVLLNGRSSASSTSELKDQQQIQQHVFDNTHPLDCPCILRVLSRDDLFLPPSMKKTIDTNEKA